MHTALAVAALAVLAGGGVVGLAFPRITLFAGPARESVVAHTARERVGRIARGARWALQRTGCFVRVRVCVRALLDEFMYTRVKGVGGWGNERNACA